MTIKIREAPHIEAYLEALLNEHSEESGVGFDHTAEKFALGLYDGEKLIGGLTGKIVLGQFHISLLAVSKDYRKRGLGKLLIEAAAEKAKARGCHHLFLTTYSYQGAGFYPKAGFALLAKIADYPAPGVDKLYFIKYL